MIGKTVNVYEACNFLNERWLKSTQRERESDVLQEFNMLNELFKKDDKTIYFVDGEGKLPEDYQEIVMFIVR